MQLQPSMDRKSDIETADAINKRISEIERECTQNSSSETSKRIPPEVLGYIFTLTIARDQDHSSLYSETYFEGLKRGSYGYLFVSHYWREVAFNTPELWSFWGNTVEDWDRLHHHAGAAPVDLVLDGYEDGQEELSAPLQEKLRDRITQDKIQRIHLRGEDSNFLGSILFNLTPNGEGAQEKRIESFIFCTKTIPKELPNFFARSRLPFLRRLQISGALPIPLWDHLESQTTRLTVLSLQITWTKFPLTTSQLVQILVANPNLQDLSLSGVLPDRVENVQLNRVPLGHLKTIDLGGNLGPIFQLLERLELPAALNLMNLNVEGPTSAEINSVLVPYLQDHFRRDVRFKEPLAVEVSFEHHFKITVCPDAWYREEEPVWPLTTISVVTGQLHPGREQLVIDLMEAIPQESVKFLQTNFISELPGILFASMLNLNHLWLEDLTLSDGFIGPFPTAPGWILLPSLISLCLKNVTAKDGNWQPLVTYLERRFSDDKLTLLQVNTGSEMSPEVANQIKRRVRSFKYNDPPDEPVHE